MTALTWILIAVVIGGLLLAAACLLLFLGGFLVARLAEALVPLGLLVWFLLHGRKSGCGWDKLEGVRYAHRGWHDKPAVPENSLPAFRRAAEAGYGAELDVHLTKDGRFVICHDDRIDRTSDGRGTIVELTLAEIKSHDFGAKFDEKYKGTPAPTLEEMLDVVKVTNPVNIEIKKFGGKYKTDEALNLFYDVLKKYDIIGNTIVSSFDAPLIKRLKQLHPDVYTCLLYNKRRSPAAYAQSLGCSAIHPYHKNLKKVTVENAHKRGLKVNCWTANEEADIRHMIEIGCDGIITNYPDRAIRIAEEE